MSRSATPGAQSAITSICTSAFHTAQSRYVVDKSREPCCVVGIVGCPRRACTRVTSSETASPPNELRLKIHGPLGNGCSPTISLRYFNIEINVKPRVSARSPLSARSFLHAILYPPTAQQPDNTYQVTSAWQSPIRTKPPFTRNNYNIFLTTENTQ